MSLAGETEDNYCSLDFTLSQPGDVGDVVGTHNVVFAAPCSWSKAKNPQGLGTASPVSSGSLCYRTARAISEHPRCGSRVNAPFALEFPVGMAVYSRFMKLKTLTGRRHMRT